jgi:predicted ATPase
MGKTRLSLAVAERLLDNFSHGVYFVSLAPLTAVENIIPAIADAVDYQFKTDGRTPEQQIIDYLHEKAVLLVMDNFEHLIAGAEIVAHLLTAAPQIKIIATSRSRLNFSGETVFILDGMDFPDWETPEDALHYSAVQLFMQSAKRANPAFELHADDLTYIARICRLVGGMPLGIVLAASWIALLSPAQIAGEIGRSLDFLEADLGDLPERQRSLRAVFEYSWNLMTPAEQAVFARLSVFRGGFSAQAAQEVAGANLRLLMSLMNKSLLRRDPATGRYDIHELLRQYAAERLTDGAATRTMHMKYYGAWLDQLVGDLKGKRQVGALTDIDVDFSNVSTAWSYAVQQHMTGTLRQMLTALTIYFAVGGRAHQTKVLFEEAIHELVPDLNAPLDNFQAWLLTCDPYTLPDPEAILRQIWDLAVREHDNRLEVIAIQRLALLMTRQNKPDRSLELWQQALKLNIDPFYHAITLVQLGTVYGFVGMAEQYFYYLNQGLEISRKTGLTNIEAVAVGNLGSYYLTRDNLPLGEQLYQESVAINRRMGNRIRAALATCFLGFSAMIKGDHETLKQVAQATAQAAREEVDWQLEMFANALLGMSAAVEGNYPVAIERLKIGTQSVNSYITNYCLMVLATTSTELGDYDLAEQSARELIRRQGEWGSITTATETFGVLGLIQAKRGNTVQAVEFIARALTISKTTNGWLKAWQTLSRTQAELEATLGQAEYQAAWERGSHLDAPNLIKAWYPDQPKRA